MGRRDKCCHDIYPLYRVSLRESSDRRMQAYSNFPHDTFRFVLQVSLVSNLTTRSKDLLQKDDTQLLLSGVAGKETQCLVSEFSIRQQLYRRGEDTRVP